MFDVLYPYYSGFRLADYVDDFTLANKLEYPVVKPPM